MRPPRIESGSDVRAFRESLGMTQVEFAAKLGYTKDHISKIERGTERETITLRFVNACKLLALTYRPKRKKSLLQTLHQ